MTLETIFSPVAIATCCLIRTQLCRIEQPEIGGKQNHLVACTEPHNSSQGISKNLYELAIGIVYSSHRLVAMCSK